MPSISRRSALAALAATAATPLLTGTAKATATTTTAQQAATTTAGMAFDQTRIPGLVAFGEPTWFPDAVRENLTVTTIPGTPTRVEVSDSHGLLASLTVGAKTVVTRGPRRSFSEQKSPFTDPFDRTVSGDWGMSPGGGNWSTANGTPADYLVENGHGVIVLAQANSSFFATLGDPEIADFNATATVTFDKMPAAADSSVALAFAYQGYDNHYRARLAMSPDGSVKLSLDKEQNDIVTSLAGAVVVGGGFTANDRWRIRVERTGTTLRTRAWRASATEPAGWTHTVQDSTFGKGKLGIRALASKNSTAVPCRALVDDFAAESGTWADPPVVTHDRWVRVLPVPFDGSWTPEIERRVRSWPTDISPDVLALAAMLQTGAAPLRSAGVQVLGDAGYGPLNPDGTRREGADFYEYMGVEWTFPNGEHRSAPTAEWHRTLDCSGMLRMVFGYHLGIPMVNDRSADFDGLTLPRRSKNIGPSGPGVVIQRNDTAPPALTGLQIGDVVCFDADPDAVGELDHVGIYQGVDQFGDHRFISSRKTANGPTMADLGGNSTLTGTGAYARALRLIRRF